MCLVVDVVKVSWGTTNDGNTASSFFDDVLTSDTVTRMNESLVEPSPLCSRPSHVDKKFLSRREISIENHRISENPKLTREVSQWPK